MRHDANVICITGIEADFDAKVFNGRMISFAEAVATMRKAGLSAILYTSPSYTEHSLVGAAARDDSGGGAVVKVRDPANSLGTNHAPDLWCGATLILPKGRMQFLSVDSLRPSGAA